MLDKLTDEQKEKLADLCYQIDEIFEDADVQRWHESGLYDEIYRVMYHLGKWC